ncbi:uncharacterized protein ACIBXB_004759 [Morphnus guianensis]
MLMPDHEYWPNPIPRSQIPGEVWGRIPEPWSDWGLDPSAPASFHPRPSVNFGARSWIFSQFWCRIPDLWSTLVPDPGSPDGFHHWIPGGSRHRIRHPQSIPVPNPGSSVSFVALSPGVTVTESRRCHCHLASPRSGVSKTGVTVTRCHRNPAASPSPRCHRHRAMRRHLNDTVRRRLDAAGCGRRGQLLPAEHRRLRRAGCAVCRDGGLVPVTPCGAGRAVPVVPCGAGCASPAVPPREVLPGPAGPVVPGPVSEPVPPVSIESPRDRGGAALRLVTSRRRRWVGTA